MDASGMSADDDHREAADLLRSGLPDLPDGLDARVLGAVERERARRRRPLWRRRGRAVGGLATGLAVLAAVVVALPLVVSDETTASVPIVVLRADCHGKSGAGDGRLVVAGTWRGAEAARFTRALERFARGAGVKVTYAYETRDIAAKLESRRLRGCPPDVALLPQPGLVAALARSGHIRPIDAVAGDLVRRNYNVTWRRLGEVDGRLYGVWYKAANKSTIWYDAAAFRAAGIDSPPITWPRLLDAAERLRATGVRPFAVAGAAPWSLTDWFENIYLQTAGARRYDQLAAHRIAWTHPSVLRALRRLSGLFGNPALIGSAAAARGTTFEESVRDVLGPRPRAAMVYEADFVRTFAAEGTPPFFGFPGDLPTGPASAVVGGDEAVLFSDRPEAGELIRFLASPEAAEPWAKAGGFISPNRALARSAYADPVMRRAARMLVDAQVVRFDLSDLQPPGFGATAGMGMWKIFQDFLESPGDERAIARRLEAAASAARG